MRDALYLVKCGVPYQMAMRMSPARRLAHVVEFGRMDGGDWDWNIGRWREKKTS